MSASGSSNGSKNVSLAEQRSDLASGLSSIRASQKVVNEEEKEEDYWAEIDVTKLRVRELRAALGARGLSTGGKKKVLQARLQQSVHEEKEEELEYLALVEAARRAEAALEESGSVYSTGLNRKGQLGLGDRTDRSEFTVIPELRGKGIMQVSAGGGDIAMALSENGNVFTWGAISTGQVAPKKEEVKLPPLKNGGSRRKRQEKPEDIPVSPLLSAGEDGVVKAQLLETLQGEGVVYIASGPNHCAAVSDSGDCYFWGDGTRGQLGTGSFSIETVPRLVETLPEGVVVSQLAVGQTHSMLLTEESTEVYTFGFSNSGKLGLGFTERKGVKPPLNKYFPEPMLVPMLSKPRVRLVCCSANHSACVTEQGVFTWGSGDGGRLGHGDHRDRLEPTLVEDLAGQTVIDMSLGFWHSAAIVQIPPIYQGGSLICWGSAYHGQLAQSDITCCLRPTLSQVCLDMRLLFIRISCGPTHCVAQTVDGDLYSWGSNKHGELGRKMVYEEDEERQYTPIPGFIPGFNTIVNRVGRGNVMSFACGKEFTLVATSKYLGETEEEMKLREQAERDEQLHKESLQKAIDLSRISKEPVDQVERLAEYNGQCCEACSGCPGFTANLFRPNVCKECGHKRKRHTLPKVERRPEH